jgi:hypothetical protein
MNTYKYVHIHLNRYVYIHTDTSAALPMDASPREGGGLVNSYINSKNIDDGNVNQSNNNNNIHNNNINIMNNNNNINNSNINTINNNINIDNNKINNRISESTNISDNSNGVVQSSLQNKEGGNFYQDSTNSSTV